MRALADYLSGLPDAYDSFPEATAKVSAFLGFFDENTMRAHLPATVVASIIGMPASSWVPEVHVAAAHIVTREVSCTSDADFTDRFRQHNFRMLSSPLYRHAFRLFQPARLARVVHSAWGLFHRGTRVRFVIQTTNSATFVLRHPPNIWPDFLRHAMLSGGTEALRVGGTSSATGTILAETPQQVRARFEW